MQKNIAFALLFLACTFTVYTRISITDDQAIQFLEGFSHVFGLDDACSTLVVCINETAPHTWNDLKLAIQALEHRNFTGAVAELILFFKDIEDLNDTCSNGVDPYLVTFGPAIQAFEHNRTAFEKTLLKNLASQPGQVATSALHLEQDLKKQDYHAAGEDFGQIAQIALNGYINTTSHVVAAHPFKFVKPAKAGFLSKMIN